MKKLFFVLAIAGLMTACKSKKADEKKAEDSTTTTATTTTTEPSATTATSGTPSFSDPEVQKFANDYAAFIAEYKAGMKDPVKLATLAKNMQDWSTRAQSIGIKLATSPEEAKKWTDWTLAMSKELMPSTK